MKYLIILLVVCISLPFFFKSKEGSDFTTPPEPTESERMDTSDQVDTSYQIDTSDQIDKSVRKYYDKYTEYLKENTNTTYDQYVGNERLKRDDSASSYIRKQIPTKDTQDEKIEEHQNLISYFIQLFKTNS